MQASFVQRGVGQRFARAPLSQQGSRVSVAAMHMAIPRPTPSRRAAEAIVPTRSEDRSKGPGIQCGGFHSALRSALARHLVQRLRAHVEHQHVGVEIHAARTNSARRNLNKYQPKTRLRAAQAAAVESCCSLGRAGGGRLFRPSFFIFWGWSMCVGGGVCVWCVSVCGIVSYRLGDLATSWAISRAFSIRRSSKKPGLFCMASLILRAASASP